jgi:putative phosphoserine phosphatase/1-acylglycerol-3-phosphate O-acyltransferase
MNRYREITREVDRSPSGPGSGAFFDFDGTLIAGFSVASFMKHRLLSGNMSLDEAIDSLVMLATYSLQRTEFDDLLVASARKLRGTPESEIDDMGKRVFEEDVAGDIYPESRALVNAHLARGHTVVMVSSATQYQVQHAAAELGIRHVLCNRLEAVDGVLTGELIAPICYGEGKADAAMEFADRNEIDLANSYFYSDGSEDIPFLQAVGHPRPTNPDEALQRWANDAGWPIRKFSSRGLPDIADVARTGLVYGGLIGSFMAGLPAWLLNGSRREMSNVAMSTWGDFGSAVAGLDINVKNEHIVWACRPAVFVFNHQSAVDTLIIARLLRRDFTGVAKKEIKSNPLVGTFLDAVGTVFVDRGDRISAVQALRPAVENLRNGISFAIAPEGQRSNGYTLGNFKKGAFHIAMQAGVPIVPVVISNASDSLPKSGFWIRPASIDVTVLPPVDTRQWQPETIDDHVNSVRNQFLEELGQAPEVDVRLRRVK